MTINSPQSDILLNESQKSELLILKDRFNSSLLDIMNTSGKYNANLDLLKVWPETRII